MSDICEYHDAWDAQGQPVGPACGETATHAIVWTTSNQWSPACVKHYDQVLQDTPPHEVHRLLMSTGSFVVKGRGTVYVSIEPDPLLVPGETIFLDDKVVVVAGIERYAIAPIPGRMIGVLVK